MCSSDLFRSKVDSIRPTYGFEDVSLAPGINTVEPSDVDIAQDFCGIRLEIPVLASAMDAVVDPAFAGSLARLGGLAGSLADVVAEEDPFQGQRGHGGHVGGDLGVQGLDHLAGDRLLVREIGEALHDLRGDGGPGLQPLGRPEIGHQTLVEAGFGLLQQDRLGLLGRDDEMTVPLHFGARRLPPFLPVLADHIGNERLLDLVHGGPSAEASEDDPDHVQVVERGLLAEAGDIGGLEGQNVVAGDGLQVFGGEAELHRVPWLALEINGQAAEDAVERLDSTESPTLVDAEAGLQDGQQWLHLFRSDLAGGDEFLEFFLHDGSFWPRWVRDGQYEREVLMKPREFAFRILSQAGPVSDFIEHRMEKDSAWRALSSPDQGLARELVLGVTRWRSAIDWIIALKTDGRPQRPAVQHLLRLGVYQLFWLDRVPDHAAVQDRKSTRLNSSH